MTTNPYDLDFSDLKEIIERDEKGKKDEIFCKLPKKSKINFFF